MKNYTHAKIIAFVALNYFGQLLSQEGLPIGIADAALGGASQTVEVWKMPKTFIVNGATGALIEHETQCLETYQKVILMSRDEQAAFLLGTTAGTALQFFIMYSILAAAQKAMPAPLYSIIEPAALITVMLSAVSSGSFFTSAMKAIIDKQPAKKDAPDPSAT